MDSKRYNYTRVTRDVSSIVQQTRFIYYRRSEEINSIEKNQTKASLDCSVIIYCTPNSK